MLLKEICHGHGIIIMNLTHTHTHTRVNKFSQNLKDSVSCFNIHFLNMF